MKAVIVAGPYGSGKTETIRGLIRGAGNEGRIGAFVAESASIALDQSRYEIGDSAIGVSFAWVCCLTLAVCGRRWIRRCATSISTCSSLSRRGTCTLR